MDIPASVLKDTGKTGLLECCCFSSFAYIIIPRINMPRYLPFCSGQLCEAPPSPLSLCELADCQNSAPCVERGGRALCQCPPEFGGPRCEKLVSVNFVDRDSYLLLSDLKNWPQANITLQVFKEAFPWVAAAFPTP